MSQIVKGEKIAEGKTKIIWNLPGYPNQVLVESKDDITAGDGAKHDILPGKAAFSTETTCNCFNFLNRMGVSTHFIERVDARTFQAWFLNMVPMEIVVRRIATGSYLKRNPKVKEGTVFDRPVVEYFLKDDARHDPLVIYDAGADRWLFYDAKKPIGEGFIEDTKDILGQSCVHLKDVVFIRQRSSAIFSILERAWSKQNVTLVDLKIEFGFRTNVEGKIAVADVIDNDSWRIWPFGDKKKAMDKQVYRDGRQALESIKQNYAWVAKATKRFVA